MEYVWYALAFGAGWAAKTAFHQAIGAIGIKLLTHATGKRKVLEMLAEGVEKLERQP